MTAATLLGISLTALLIAAPFVEPTAADTSITVNPGDDIQAIVAANPPGTTFVLNPGTYRMQSVIPRDGNIFDGQGRAIFNGSRLLTSFKVSGELWIATDQDHHGRVSGAGECQPTSPRCDRSEDLYLDDEPLRHVSRLRDVGPGKWHFDNRNRSVYMGDNPIGKIVEMSASSRAFGGNASNVTIKALTIEKYATPLQMSAVDAEHGESWLIENNTIRLNHAVGVNAGQNAKVLRNKLIKNGQEGFSGGGRGFLIERNEVAFNNYAGVKYTWEAGGGKVTDSPGGAVIRSNCVHHNDGPGIWADGDVKGLIIERNVVYRNTDNGIMYEISDDGVIRDNTVADNGEKALGWLWGPQILISSARNVHVYNNYVDVSDRFGNAISIVSQNRPPHTPAMGNHVYANTIVMRGITSRIGAVTDVGADRSTVAEKNGIRGNLYHVADPSATYWHWNQSILDWKGIQSMGQEVGGVIDGLVPAKPPLDCVFLGLSRER